MSQRSKRSVISAPFIFIATNKLREGKLAAERDRAADLASFIEANEPQVLAFNEYVNDDGTEVGVVQIHPNAASMEFHMDVVAERAARAYAETLEGTTSIQVYGELRPMRSPVLGRCFRATTGLPRFRPETATVRTRWLRAALGKAAHDLAAEAGARASRRGASRRRQL